MRLPCFRFRTLMILGWCALFASLVYFPDGASLIARLWALAVLTLLVVVWIMMALVRIVREIGINAFFR
jgi:hypothetical protein